jgi:hypothetical protein
MNAPRLPNSIPVGAVPVSSAIRRRYKVLDKQVIKALEYFGSVAVGAGTGTAAWTVELWNRGQDGLGTTLLARITNDTTTYPANTAQTTAGALPANGVGVTHLLGSENAAVTAQGEGFLHLEGVNVLKNDVLELLITTGSAATVGADVTVTVFYAPGQN